MKNEHYVGTGKVHRFPRLDDEDAAKERAGLEQKAFAMLTRPLEWRIELGRTFIRIKATLEHGRWESYFAETFTAPFDITLRTGENYMTLAREADAKTKNENASISESASDPEAVEMDQATSQGEAEVGDRRYFNVPLLLTPDERKAIHRLLKSARWREARQEITKFVNRLCEKFGIAVEAQDEAAAD